MTTEPSGVELPDTDRDDDGRPAAGQPAAGQPDAAARPAVGHADEPHTDGLAERLNWLRAGVLGANDGIVSTAGLVIGVAAASTCR